MPNTHENLTSLFSDIADAIRAKTGENRLLTADEFPGEIDAIQTGGGGGDNYDYFWVENISDTETNAIKFEETGTVDVELQYSENKSTWTDYTLGTSITINPEQKIYWKNNKNYLSKSASDYVTIYFTNGTEQNIKIGGKLSSLWNDVVGNSIYTYCANNLFYCAYSLVDASELLLPPYVSSHCYYNMFAMCDHLTAPPALPATLLDTHCYDNMFNHCVALTTAPELPATTLASNCYSNMFNSCESLTTAPELPATNLVSGCYTYMFYGCVALTTVPELPATDLVSSCYSYMFTACSALKVYSESGEGHDKAWSIPSTETVTSTSRTQYGMFNGVETDSIPAEFRFEQGQQYTFYTQNTPV